MASCRVHAIGAGPDGRCALCRASQPVEPTKPSGQRVWLLLGGFVLLCGGLLASRQLFLSGAPEVAVAEPSVPAQLVPVASVPSQPLTEPPEVAPLPVKDLTLGGTLPAPGALAEVLAEPFAVASAAPENVAPAAPSAGKSAPSAAQIEAAMRAVPIVMYSTAWCSVCDRARAFLSSHGFAFREVDIERDQTARAEVKRQTGRTAVPVLEIDGVMGATGFSEASTASAIAASVERRLGVTGIQVRHAPR